MKVWHYRRSLASRVVLLTTVAVGLSVALLSVGVYVTARMQMQASLDNTLLDRAKSAAASDVLVHLQLGEDSIPSWALAAGDVRIAYINQGRQIFPTEPGTPRLFLGDPELAVADGAREMSVRTLTDEAGEQYRVVAVPVARFESTALVLAQSKESQQRVLGRLGIVMGGFGLAGVLGAGLAGWVVAANGLRPVRRLTDAVEQITRTEDLTPLPVEGDDEIARLAGAFNGLLVALGASRDRQRQLVADAGHELRTPLTSMRTNIDLLAQTSRRPESEGGLPAEARAELIGDVKAQMEELTTLIGDLVELARDEPLPPVVSGVALPDVVDHAVTRVRRRAPDVEFDVLCEPWWVVGEEQGLERAVTNLLDNAAKWSPAGGTVTVRLLSGELIVEDEGPGITDTDLPHVFDRFYRATESRSMPGSGLGLSIVRQVAERHGGTVTAGRAASGGARLVLRLPGAPSPMPTEVPHA